MTANEIRGNFLEYFERHGHRRVPSSSLVPVGDPTLLFANAGMNQFKDIFLGLEQREYKRATSAQKCLRAGGKHNDLENVGFTNRHHTFFEMLGNFSFGDYFKKEAIQFAWNLVTSRNWFGIPKEKLYITIFKGQEGIARDAEAHDHWLSQGVPQHRLHELGWKENFWVMGDTGPCGPSSEIHYDMGSAASDEGHADCQFGCSCGRYVEIWNLVFMQFNRDATGKLTALPQPSVDTGAGLERLAAVLQEKTSNFDTDLFVPLLGLAGKLSGKTYGKSPETDISLRIIADHSRAATFLIADGVWPENEGRGYVLRKIIRRALRHGRMLGIEGPYLNQMAVEVASVMREPYPELEHKLDGIVSAIQSEEIHYERTLKVALGKLDEELKTVAERTPGVSIGHREDGTVEIAEPRSGRPLILSGEIAFRLYDTYGLSVDLLQEEGTWRGFQVDREGFEREMQKQRERAKASWKRAGKEVARPIYAKLAETYPTELDFYQGTVARDCRIEAIVTPEGPVAEIQPGTEAEVVLDRTALYAESGGQVADIGWFYDHPQSIEVAEVRSAYYPVAGLIAHRILAKQTLRVGDRVTAVAAADRRERIKRNHTATHLVHAALRNVLGLHVKQAGSLVAPDHLRFDFSHFTSLDEQELRDIEQQVNEHILQNAAVETDITGLDEAMASGALAFFGDKYPEHKVRVVTIPDANSPRGFYSKELCGGTHVHRSGNIGVFKITTEQSVAAGVRRIQAMTGLTAFAAYQNALRLLGQLSATLNVAEDALPAAVERLAAASKQLEKQLETLQRESAHSKTDELLEQARTVKDVRVISARVEGLDRHRLRQLVDSLRQKLGSGVVALATTEDGKVAIVTGVTKDLTARLHAGKIVQAVARAVGGTGGGRPDLAEAGGKDTSGLKSAMEGVYSVVEQML